MKKFLKIIGIILGILVLLVGGFILYLNFAGLPVYGDVKRPEIKVEVTAERVMRGKKFVTMLCAGCHQNPVTGKLTGQHLTDMGAFGEIYSQNLTQDPNVGIANWKDGEIIYFLRTGVHRDGRYVPPYMPKLPNLAEEDMMSIIAFLRSSDQLVQADPTPDTACKPSILAKLLARVAFSPLEYPKTAITVPAQDDKLKIGRYFVANLGCYQCHSADFKTNKEVDIENSKGFLGGGNELLDASGRKMYVPNITADKEYGIGKLSEAEFIRVVRDGFRPDNSPVRFPMERYVELTDAEISGIYAYIHSMPALATPNKHFEANDAGKFATQGEMIYKKYSCFSCHGNAGIGTCDLREAYHKYGSNDSLITWIKDPSKIKPGSKMPTWQGVIKDEEYVPLAEYVRLLGERRNSAPATSAK